MAAEIRVVAGEVDSGKTVERILKNHFNVSSSLLTYMKLNSRLFLNGQNCRTVDICKNGDTIVADVSEESKPENISLWEHQLDILYDDDFLTVVNKPGGMEVHPCPSNRKTTLANAIMYYWGQKGEYHNYHIVNRLDKDTSGICIIAKNRFAHGVLCSQLKNDIFERSYTAIVHGIFSPANGCIEAPIKRSAESIIKRTVSDDGKYAKTNYKTQEVLNNGFSVVDAKLETGRTHQIRVHFSYCGHPLVGDWLYGSGDNERNLIKRHALHAKSISFVHPMNKERMTFDSILPDDMKKLLEAL